MYSINLGIVGDTGRFGSLLSDTIINNGHKITYRRNSTRELRSGKADVLFECARPTATLASLEYALDFNIPLILATSGHNKEQNIIIKKTSKKIPIIVAQNLSHGHLLQRKIVSILSKYTSSSVSILDVHPSAKIDSPSGTAKLLGTYFSNPEIKSVRVDTDSILHRVTCHLSDNDMLEITHRVASLRPAVIGATALIQISRNLQDSGLYRMDVTPAGQICLEQEST